MEDYVETHMYKSVYQQQQGSPAVSGEHRGEITSSTDYNEMYTTNSIATQPPPHEY